MLVRDLIDVLKNMQPDLEVHISYQSNDYWRTVVAPKVDAVSVETVSYSDYHRMQCITDGDDDSDSTVCVIS